MSTTDSKDELIKLHFQATTKRKAVEKYGYGNLRKHLNDNFDRIEVAHLQTGSNLLAEGLYEAYTKGEDIYKVALELSEKMNATINNILKVVTRYIDNGDLDIPYKYALNDMKYEIEKKIILSKRTEKVNREYEIAKNIMTLFLDNNYTNSEDFQRDFHCSYYLFNKMIDVLESRNHPLYFKYLDVKDKAIRATISNFRAFEADEKDAERNNNKEKIKTMNNEEIFNILSYPKTGNFALFCQVNNFSTALLRFFIKNDESLAKKLAFDPQNRRKLYDEIKDKYRAILIEIGKEVNLLEQEGRGRPFNLYGYYSKYSVNFNELVKIGLSFDGLPNQNKILNYFERNRTLFDPIDRARITGLSQIGRLNCGNMGIKFTTGDLYKALEEINEKKYPLVKGVLYGAIKKQIRLRKSNMGPKKTKKLN